MSYLYVVIGLALLTVGGQALVNGSVSLARRLGVSNLMIGLTLVGFGTSTPELVTSLQGALAGSPGIAVGNVVGSNTANILLILGIAAIIYPLVAERRAFLRDGSMAILAAVICTVLVLTGTIGRVAGLAMMVALVVYLVVTYRLERTSGDAAARVHAGEAEVVAPVTGSAWLAVLATLGGLALTILGGFLLVDGAVTIARSSGVSETIIGLTLVAVGTSVPELVTSVIAALKRHTDVALGNILGSNIYNVLGILGVTAVVQPLDVPAALATVDIWVMLGATLAMVVFAVSGWRLNRIEGGILLASYGVYLGYLISVA